MPKIRIPCTYTTQAARDADSSSRAHGNSTAVTGLGLLIRILEIDFNDFNSLLWAGLVSPHSDRIEGCISQYRTASDDARIFDTAVRRNNHFDFHSSAQLQLPCQRGVLRFDLRLGFALDFCLIGFLRERRWL